MIHNLLHAGLRRTGRDTQIDPGIPTGALVSQMLTAAASLLRGMLRLHSRAFIGRAVKIRGKGLLHVGPYAHIETGVELDCVSRNGVHLGPASRVGRGSRLTTTSHLSRLGDGFTLGARSGLGDHCHIGASGGVHIGDDVIAGPYVSFHSQEHVYSDPNRPIRSQGTTEAGIRVGNDCWIGAKATLLDGTSVGDGCVIAAGAVLKGPFPAGSVIAGVPARVVKQRSAEAPS